MTAEHAAPAAPALGISLQVSCGETVQMVLQTHVPLDATPEEHAAAVDRACHIADRVNARYSIVGLRKLIKEKRASIAFTEDQFRRAELTHEADKARRIRESEQAATDDEAAWNSGNKRGDYSPSNGFMQRLKALRHEQVKADEERERTLANEGVTRDTMAAAIAAWEQEIQQLQAVIDGPHSRADR
jgi:hypothetical protein